MMGVYSMSLEENIWETPSEGCLQDESGLHGNCAGVAYVKNISEIQAAIHYANRLHTPITIQGGLTGLKGAAVPNGGYVINTSRMNRVLAFRYDTEYNTGYIRVQPGLTLGELQVCLNEKLLEDSFLDTESRKDWLQYCSAETRLHFPPNPSEPSATIGGMAACNATGSRTRTCGGMRAFLSEATVISSSGEVYHYTQKQFNSYEQADYKTVRSFSPSDNGFEAGYFFDGNPIHLLCGSEGTLGLIAELTLNLSAVGSQPQGLLLPFETVSQLEKFWTILKPNIPQAHLSDALCFHYACFQKLALAETDGLAIPEHGGLLFLEFYEANDDDFYQVLEQLLPVAVNTGISADTILVASSPQQVSTFSRLRHKLIECIRPSNSSTSLHGADLYIEGHDFFRAFQEQGEWLTQFSIPGLLIGNCLTHQSNFYLAAESPQQKESLAPIVPEWETSWQKRGYRCSAEYGIGRLKKRQFRLFSSENYEKTYGYLRKMCPNYRFNPDLFKSENG